MADAPDEAAILLLLQRQQERLDRLTDEAARRLLREFLRARPVLRDRLEQWLLIDGDGDRAFTTQQVAGTLAQVEDAIRYLRLRLGIVLTEAVAKAAQASIDDLVTLVRASEPDLLGAVVRVNPDIIERLSRPNGLALHDASLDRYSRNLVDAIQQKLVQAATNKLTLYQTIQNIAGLNNSAMSDARWAARAETIARVEWMRAYNDKHLESIAEMDALTALPGDTDPLLKRIIEVRDVRSVPVSFALHNQTRRPNEPFFVTAAAIIAEGARLKRGRGLHGLLWPAVGDGFQGMNLPAHYNDRGRIIPWRRSWGALTS